MECWGICYPNLLRNLAKTYSVLLPSVFAPAFRENEMREVKSAVCSPVGSPLPDSVALRPVLEALLNLLCSTYASALWGRASCLQQKTFLETLQCEHTRVVKMTFSLKISYQNR